MYYCCGITDAGVRDHNEDAYLINKKVRWSSCAEEHVQAPFIAAVADGVSGEASGEVASRLALEHLGRVKAASDTDYAKKLLDIHKNLRKSGIAQKNINMQTTLCALAVCADKSAFILNVGDSKLFRFRGGVIKQLSTDQSLVQYLYEKGEITAEEKRRHSHRNVIFPVLGNTGEDPKTEVTPIEGGIAAGDLILICTDGLADYITTGEFEDTLALPQKLPKRLSALVALAKKGGSTDNITAVAVSLI